MLVYLIGAVGKHFLTAPIIFRRVGCRLPDSALFRQKVYCKWIDHDVSDTNSTIQLKISKKILVNSFLFKGLSIDLGAIITR